MRSLQIKILLVFGALVMITVSGVSFYAYGAAKSIIEKTLGRQALNITIKAREEVDAAQLKKVADAVRDLKQAGEPLDAILKMPEYINIRQRLSYFRESFGLKYLYTVAEWTPGRYMYLVDGFPLNYAGEGLSLPGDIEANNYAGFRNTFINHEPQAGYLETDDTWGATLASFAPIFTPDGQFIGIVGADFEASGIYRLIDNSQRNLTIVVVCALLFSAAATFALAKLIVTPLKRLNQNVRAIRNNNLDTEIEVSGEDEVAQIARSCLEMRNALKDTFQKLANAAKQHEESNLQLEQNNDELAQRSQALELSQRQLTESNLTLENRTRELESAQKIVEQQLQKLLRESSYKSRFAATVSHELRTPLNTVLLLSRLLTERQDALPDDKKQEYFRSIQASASDLMELINNILEYSRLQTGIPALNAGSMALDHLLYDLEYAFRPMAESQNLEFRVDILPDTPLYISTDRMRLAQILRNLLSNAFKFTTAGSVCLQVACEASRELADAAENRLVFRITDTGPGIDPDLHEAAFEPFRQISSMSATRAGSGLGLAIARELARLLHGELALKSMPGKGSTFTLTIPYLTATDRPTGSSTHAQSSASKDSLAGMRILIAEDDDMSAFALQQSLLGTGAEIIRVSHGKDAVQYLDDADPVDAVLMDIMMPVMDGLTATQEIRSTLGLHHLPLIALTARMMPGDEKKYRAAGLDHCLSKPVDMGKLMYLLQQIWRPQ